MTVTTSHVDKSTGSIPVIASKSAELANRIETAYALLAARGSFTLRPSQKEFSLAVAESFMSGTTLVAEAPTGTGKTLAYLIGALVWKAVSRSNRRVFVSTATKALQQQVLDNDIPKLVGIGLLSSSQVGLVKGKGNYLCLRDAHQLFDTLEEAELDPEMYLGEAAQKLSSTEVKAVITTYESGVWQGDFDKFPGRAPVTFKGIAVNSETCVGRKSCGYGEQCAYFRDRADLELKDVLLVNHDLLLREVQNSSEGLATPLATLLEGSRVVLDEGHHLPAKALSVGAVDVSLTGAVRELSRLSGLEKLLSSNPELADLMSRHFASPSHDRTTLANLIRSALDTLDPLDVDADTGQRRFAGGSVPSDVTEALTAISAKAASSNLNARALQGDLRTGACVGSVSAAKLMEVQQRLADVATLLERLAKACAALAGTNRMVRWLFRKNGETSIHASYLDAVDILRALLWDGLSSRRIGSIVITSATLSDTSGFARFQRETGAPAGTVFKKLPPVFPYGESQLVVVGMQHTPKFSERTAYQKELQTKLPDAINPAEGSLVLFSSWGSLRTFAPLLKARFGGSTVRVQGEQGVAGLVREHKAAIDAGQGSILVGVATLSEGLDLPGAYCTHVLVAALPFAVPTSPVEQEHEEILKNRYFEERALPEAASRMNQIAGRLIRRESDRGRITVFDRRLASTGYGRKILEQLPPFKVVVEPVR